MAIPFVKDGHRLSVTLTEDTPANTPILVGDKVVVTCVDGLNGETVEAYTKGVFLFASTGTINKGKQVKFNNTTKVMSAVTVVDDAADVPDIVHGIAWEAAASNLVPVCID
jgi:predicted RecA/RadA family phage recombinase